MIWMQQRCLHFLFEPENQSSILLIQKNIKDSEFSDEEENDLNPLSPSINSFHSNPFATEFNKEKTLK
jgi:hypothetical protein